MKKRLTWGAALAAGALVIPVTAAQADEGDLVEFTVEVEECVEAEFAEVEVNDVDADNDKVANDVLSGEGVGKKGFNHFNIEVDTDTSCVLSKDVVVTENGIEVDGLIIDLTAADKNLHVTWNGIVTEDHGLDPQDGSDDDGSDDDGSNEDGSNEDGQDDDGANENGDDPSEDDSGDENGADDAGSDENGSDEDGDSDDTVSADDSEITVSSGDGNAEAATPVTAQPRNVG